MYVRVSFSSIVCLLLLFLGVGMLALTATAARGDEEARVCFYEYSDYDGAEWCYGPGDYPQMETTRDNRISSLRLYGDAAVTVFEQSGFEGTQAQILANVYSFSQLNDAISSFRVTQRQGQGFACLFEDKTFGGTPQCQESGGSITNLDDHATGRTDNRSLLLSGPVELRLFQKTGLGKRGKAQGIDRSSSYLRNVPFESYESETASLKVVQRDRDSREQAVALQNALARNMPLAQRDFLATHNSYNSAAYFANFVIPGLNHSRSLTEQLEYGTRFFELDIYSGRYGTKVCHSVDCFRSSISLRRLLGEVDNWMKGAAPDEVLLFFLQDELDGRTASYRRLEADLAWLGDVYVADACGRDLANLTWDKVLAQGKRYVFYRSGNDSGCYPAPSVAAGLFFERNISVKNIDVDRDHFDPTHLLRSQECRNSLCQDRVSGDEALRGIKNGVNAFGLDQLLPKDIDKPTGRFNRQLWSVGPEQMDESLMREGRTLLFQASGNRYFKPGWGGTQAYYACRSEWGKWRVSRTTGVGWAGDAACQALGEEYSYDVPMSAYEAKELAEKMKEGQQLHVNFGVEGGRWKAGLWGTLSLR